MRNNLTQYLIGILTVVFLCTCTQNEVYCKFVSIHQNKWSKDNQVCFEIDSLLLNPKRSYNVDIEITHNINYAYKSLWLYINHTYQDTIVVGSDTLELMLSNDIGQWKGRGNGSTRHLSVIYKTDLKLDTIKHAKVHISHAMQDFQLKGIEKVGLEIY